jgi:6,7-dimethyl-8-ribityllumazine synthase
MQLANRGSIELFDAKSWKLGIVVAQFNADITNELYDAAVARAAQYQILPQNITTLRVAGAIEIPVALQHLAGTSEYDA